jgi:hypothetical protein
MNPVIDSPSRLAQTLLAAWGLCVLLAAPSDAAGITGRATGPGGTTSLRQVYVTAYLFCGPGKWIGASSVYTDANGEYELWGLAAGTYRIGFRDHRAGHMGEYYDNVQAIDEAMDITVAIGETIAGIDASLSIPPTHTSTTPVPVPFAWLDGYPSLMASAGGDYETAAWMANGKCDGAGNALAVWQDYVAGTCPTNPASRFRCIIEMRQGAPVLRWEPDLGDGRIYTLWGRPSLLEGDWATPTNAASRFFRVKVSMP